MRITLTQHSTPVAGDLETPVGFFIRLAGDSQGILCESAEVDGRWGRYSIIATDFPLTAAASAGLLKLRMADERLTPLRIHEGKPFIQGLRDLMADLEIAPDRSPPLPPITRGLYGYFGFGAASMFEPKLTAVLPPEQAQAALALPGSLIIFDHRYNNITKAKLHLDGSPLTPLPLVAGGEAGPEQNRLPCPTASREGFISAVIKVKEMLRQGEAIQVVLSTPFSAPLAESPFSLYRRLRASNPSPYMFYMNLNGTVLAGSSPEVLVSCEQNKLRLCPIAGTKSRGSDPAEDALFGDLLLQDPKEQAEHVMLVDLGRNDLGRIAHPGTVCLERYMEVERFSHVMHLTSRISARLADGKDALDVLGAALPAGTVSGAPKVRAIEIIAKEEQRPRGLYAGAAGWIGLDKDSVNLDFGIIIRSLWVRDGRINWQAGAGIVQDSDPEKEWLECLAKAAVMRCAVTGEAPPLQKNLPSRLASA